MITFAGVEVDISPAPGADVPVARGPRGLQGIPGASAYDAAVEAGYVGTVVEWLNSLPGADGREVELQSTETHVQWRYIDGTWSNLIALADLKGDAGDQLELRTDDGFIQWRLTGGTWANLVGLELLQGDAGASAYDVAVADGFIGTAAEWLASLTGEDGDPGPAPEFQVGATHIQWRVEGDAAWIDLVALDDLQGEPGAPATDIELQTSATHIQWRLEGGSWTDLVALADLKGEPGDVGSSVELQTTDTHIQWRVEGGTWANLIALSAITGPPGDDADNLELQTTDTHIQWRVVGGTWADLVALEDLKGEPGAPGALNPSSDLTLTNINGPGFQAFPAEFAIMRASFSGAGRVRLYRTEAGRDADAVRPVGTAYPGGRERVYEYVALGAETDEQEPFIVLRGTGETGLFYQVDGGPVTVVLTIKEL